MRKYIFIIVASLFTAMFIACANIGRPDGGPFDELPPVMLKSVPEQRGINVSKKKINIEFDEYITLENPSEKIVISPPQTKTPEINAIGKKIIINFLDTLVKNATYTIDFGDAIVDNNEGNALENFVFTFSTGAAIDTMEVSGTVLNASDLEPKKGMLVGLYSNLSDTAFTTMKMERIGRTDSRGQFCIKGIKPGKYNIYALIDNDQNYMFSQKSEEIAFIDSLIVPTSFLDIRYDTTWVDTLTIDTIKAVEYTHYMPDNIILKAFQEEYKIQNLLKNDRLTKEKFTLYFNAKADSLPEIKGLNFDETDAFVIEKSMTNDTISYWIRDSLIYNVDTLQLAVTYTTKDSLMQDYRRTDTIRTVTKKTFEKKKKKKKDDEPEPIPALQVNLESISGTFDGYKDIDVSFSEPLASYERSAMNIQMKVDTTYQNIPFNFEKDSTRERHYKWIANWEESREYKLTVDSGTIRGIYGLTNERIEKTFKIRPISEYGMIVIKIHGLDGRTAFAELLNKSDKPIRKVNVMNDVAEFNFLPAGKYYVRLCIDSDGNGEWTTGNFEKRKHPEEVFYYNGVIELKAMWTIEQDWNLYAVPADKQKLDEIKTQKPETKKKTQKKRTYQGN